ncbi:MAG: DUF455 family protein [Opitutaceae bacterium]
MNASPPEPRAPAPAASPRAHLNVADSAVILKRFYFVERALIVLQAGWLPGVEHWGTKLALPETLWENSVLARELRNRILELRYPERRIVAGDDEPLVARFRQCGDAPNGLAFVRALAEAARPYTRELYSSYRRIADALDDAPTLFFLNHALADFERQDERLRAASRGYAVVYPEQTAAADRWVAAVRAVFDQTPHALFFRPDAPPAWDGSVLTAAGGRPLRISRTGARDRRFRRCAFAWPDRLKPGDPGEGRRLQLRQAVHHANEVWASEMAAACLHDLADKGPAEFLEDAARWCFDEIRHCRMGYERLKAWRFAEADIPLDAFSYDAGQSLDAIGRLGIIFFFESTYIHTKPERTRIFRDLGDRLSSHDMDFDWADELVHTHYGKRWLEFFLAAEGAGRTPADIKRAAQAAVERRQAEASAEDQAATEQAFQAVLAKDGASS